MMAAVTLKEIKDDNKKAAKWLLYYPQLKEQYQKDRSDVLNGTHAFDNIGGSRSGVGNPTQSKVIMLSDILQTEQWIQTIEDVHIILGPKKLIFLQVRREVTVLPQSKERGRPSWIPYVQYRYAEEIAKYYGADESRCIVHEKTLEEWWKKMVDLTARIAIKRRCL